MADANDEEGRSRRFWAVVAVTGLGLQVVLVAIVGAIALTYLLGLGSTLEAGPTADFSGDAVVGSYVLSHEGGDALEATDVAVRRNGEDVGTWAELSPATGAEGRVSAGNRLTLPTVEEGDTITVFWDEEDNSAVLFEDEVGPLRTPTPTPKTTGAPIPTSKTTETPQRSSSTTGTPRPATSAAKAAESLARLANVS